MFRTFKEEIGNLNDISAALTSATNDFLDEKIITIPPIKLSFGDYKVYIDPDLAEVNELMQDTLAKLINILSTYYR